MNAIVGRSSARAGAKHRARFAFLLVLLLGATRARAGDVTVALDDSAHACRVSGGFMAPVSIAVAWDVLTDYDHIDRFVRSMVSSHAQRRPDGSISVRQVAVGGVFIFHRRMQVELETREEPGRRISFRDVLGKDFVSYAGQWEIVPDSANTWVSYHLAAEPHGALARAACRTALGHTAEELLEQVRAEMMRRGKVARAHRH